MSFPKDVQDEIAAARKKHGAINSLHEGYGVILEELEEFWEQVKRKDSKRDYKEIYSELVQVAAMAQKCAEDVVVKRIH